LPILGEIAVLFFFMLVVFGTIGTQMLGGHLRNRCMSYDPVIGEISPFLGDEQGEVICTVEE
jgi:hypothetical protein